MAGLNDGEMLAKIYNMAVKSLCMMCINDVGIGKEDYGGQNQGYMRQLLN